MATPWTFDQRIAAYKAAGITKIVIMKGAQTHNRDGATGKAFGPVYGLTVHHTAGVGSGVKDLCYNGTGDLPGPLVQDFLAKDGTLYVVGHGRCNHAGTVTPAVKAAIIAEKAPVASMRNGDETQDGNDFLFGLEIENKGDGKDSYPAVQYAVAIKWAVAHLKHYGWSVNSVWGHKEITSRKIDPSFPKGMGQFRTDVSKALGGTTTPVEEDVALSADDIKKVAAAVKAGLDLEVWGYHGKLGDNQDPRDSYAYLRDAEKKIAALQAQMATLNAKLDSVTALGPVNVEMLAAKVADQLAQRLAS